LTPWFEYSALGVGGTVPLTSQGQPVETDEGGFLEANEPASQTFQYGLYLSAEFAL
jgi:hypothetical protein